MITLIKTGTTIAEIATAHGDFEDWFRRGLGVDKLDVIEVYKGQTLPPPGSLHAVVITGSAAMVSHRERWSERTANWLKQAVPSGLPVLGVCYGHQLLAHALGGRVGINPNGRQIGTITADKLATADTDRLLGSLPQQFKAQTSHSEAVLEIPTGAQRLAECDKDRNFALRFGDNAWGVQFHPEFSTAIMSRYIEYRSEAISAEGLDVEALLTGVEDAGQAGGVLRQFVSIL